MTDLSLSQPDPDREASSGDPIEGIGGRLTLLRKLQRRKISSLAREVGVSPSLISQIERGQSRPSVSTLFALAEALEVPVDAFFRDGVFSRRMSPQAVASAPPEEDDDDRADEAPAPQATGRVAHLNRRYVVKHDDRATIEIEGGVRWERLTPTALDKLEFLELVYSPHAESNSELYRHPGSEMVVVIEGRLQIHIGFEQYELEAGDSIHFPSAFPHRYVNTTDAMTRAITVILFEPGADGPAHHHRL